MSDLEVNREDVLRRKRRLLEEYGETPVEERAPDGEDVWEIPPEEFEDFLGYAREGYVGGGYVWVVRHPEDVPELTESMPDDAREDREHALMILGRGDGPPEWGLPGGGREGEETYEEAAVREVREETSVECEITDLFLLRHVPVVSSGDHDERIHHLSAFFDGRYLGGSIAIQPGELNGAAWFSELPERLMPANRRRAETWEP